MGTRSLTIVEDGFGECCVLYRQYDGYPKGHGKELKEFLTEFNMVKGLVLDTPKKTANGMDCLAAQLVAHFKTEPGNFYLYPSETRDCGEEYVYTIYLKDDWLSLRVQSGEVTYFGLPGTNQKEMRTIYQGRVDHFDPESPEKSCLETDTANHEAKEGL